jgi:hypothetical protein
MARDPFPECDHRRSTGHRSVPSAACACSKYRPVGVSARQPASGRSQLPSSASCFAWVLATSLVPASSRIKTGGHRTAPRSERGSRLKRIRTRSAAGVMDSCSRMATCTSRAGARPLVVGRRRARGTRFSGRTGLVWFDAPGLQHPSKCVLCNALGTRLRWGAECAGSIWGGGVIGDQCILAEPVRTRLDVVSSSAGARSRCLH